MKCSIYCLVLMLVVVTNTITAQPFVIKQYNFKVDSNVVYASDTNYIGYPEDLTMHIYKPIGDNNTKRPILIYIHGGSWIGGTPNDYYPNRVSEEFVRRGYVVANIQYRMGMHTNPNIIPGTNCPLIAGATKCAYVADTIEVLRAAFRAIQDGKSAVRYMKSRHVQDSTCAEALFVVGESAGAFTALGLAFLDDEAERFDACQSMPAAPTSNNALSFCQNLFDHLPLGQTPNYTRPDLGSVHGRTNINGFNAQVQGVGAFYGAFFYEALTKNWLKGVDTPSLYMFHQGNDLVVSCGTGRPIMTTNQCIQYVNLGFNDCVSMRNLPIAFGSCGINGYLQSINYTKYKFEFVNNYTGNPLLDCNNTGQPGQGHNIDNIAKRCDTLAAMFSPLALKSIANCINTGLESTVRGSLYAYPNPMHDVMYMALPKGYIVDEVLVTNVVGQVVSKQKYTANGLFMSNLMPGVYFIETQHKGIKYFGKVVKQ